MAFRTSILSVLVFLLATSYAFSQGWGEEVRLPTPTQEVAVAGLNGIVYVAAGSLNQTRTNAAWAYDPSTHTWTSLAPYPSTAVDHANLVADGAFLYLIGGVSMWPQPSVINVSKYDPATNTWTAVAPLPVARGAMGSAVINGKIYVAGGLENGASVSDFTIYDPATDTWSTLPHMPTARDHLAAAAVNGKFYAIGGRVNGQNCAPFNLVEIFDPATNAWTTGPEMANAHAGHAVGTVNGHIQVFGGEGAASTCGTIAASEDFDPASNTWTALPNMPTPRHGIGSATINSSAYIPGGATWTGDAATPVHERFDATLPNSTEPVPAPWTDLDIGTLNVAGSASFTNGTFVVRTSGSDIWGGADGFHYVYLPLSGDGQIVARVIGLGYSSQFAKAGVMIRETLTAGSVHVLLDAKPDNTLEFMTRSSPGGSTTFLAGGNQGQPAWLKLARTGSTFTASVSLDHSTWTTVGTTTVAMAASVYVGLAVTPHNSSAMTAASIDNVTVTSATTGDVPPTVTLTSPGNNATFTAPATVTFAANASDSDGTISRVDFFANNTQIGTSVAAPYGGTWKSVPAGSYTITAVATDNAGLNTTSNAASITVSTAPGGGGSLPSPWTNEDIGSVGVAASASASNGIITVQAAGADIWGTADSFNYTSQPLSGDGQIVARVTSLQNTDANAKAGIMFREALSAGAVDVILDVEPSGNIEFMTRTSASGSTTFIAGGTQAFPTWLQLARSGSTFTASVSADGNAWRPIGMTTVSMAASANVGLAVTSHTTSTLTTATFDAISVSGPPPPPPPPGLPAPWANQDIGAVGLAGSATDNNGMFTVVGAGSDIWGTADSFQFAYQSLSGDGQIVARVTSLQNTDANAKAGVVFRETLSAGALDVILDVEPGGNIEFMARGVSDGQTTWLAGASQLPPVFLKLARNGSTITGFTSTDGSTWTSIGTTTVTMATNANVGLAVTSHTTSTLTTATFDTVSVTPTPPQNLPAPWADQDIGTVGSAGSASDSNGVFTIIGAGSDIWGTADSFHFVYQPLSGDGQIVARVTGLQDTDANAKAGIMFRETLSSASAHVILDVEPSGNIEFMTRSVDGGQTTWLAGAMHLAPVFLKLARSGSTITGSVSSDGDTWTVVGSTSLSATAYVGLAVTSHTTSQLDTSTFDSVTVTSGGGGGAAPGTPASPSPPSNATGVTTRPILTWSSSGATSYDVAFGTSSPPSIVSTGQTSASYSTPLLDNSTQYFWQVTAHNSAGMTTGPMWTFTTVASSGGSLPAPWTNEDIGTVGLAGSVSASNGIFTVQAAGADIWGTADSFNFTSQPFSGDSQITARVTGLQSTNTFAKAGVMFRDALTAGSVDVILDVRPDGSLELMTRTASGASTAFLATGTQAFPTWLRLARSGSTFSASVSADGATWTPVGTTAVTMATSANVGLAVTSHTTSTLTTATFDTISVIGTTPTPPGTPTSPVPATGATKVTATPTLTWTSSSATTYDVRFGTTNPPPAATTGQAAASYSPATLNTSTTYFWQVIAHNSVGTTTGPVWSFTTMVSPPPGTPTSPSPAFEASAVSTTTTLTWTDNGSTSYDIAFGTSDPPPTVSSAQASTTYAPGNLASSTTYYWRVVAHNANGSTIGPLWVFTTAASSGTNGLPAGWTDADVGSVDAQGAASYSAGVFSVNGGGVGIGGTADAFNFVSQTLNGDGQITARVTSLQNTNANAKAGLTIRATLDTNVPAVTVDLEPDGSIDFTARSLAGASTSELLEEPTQSFPMWIRVARSGSTFVAYVSQNGATWTCLGTTTMSMASSVSIGLAATSGTTSAAATATFDNVTIEPVALTPPPAITFARKTLVVGGTGTGTAVGISGFASPSSLTLGPDGNLYVATVAGIIYVLTLDHSTLMQPAQSSVTHVQEIDSIFLKPSIVCDNTGNNCQLQNASTGRQVTGIAIDPASTPSNIILYVSNSNLGNGTTDITVYPYSGTITRLVLHPNTSSPGDYVVAGSQDLVIGLPRSREAHSVNGMSIGSDGWLYLAIGSNTNAGQPSDFFLNLPEFYLSASVVRLNLTSLPAGLPIDVTNVKTGSDMIPWQGMFELYATGYRNPYDIAWHSNGKLYLNMNSPNLVQGLTPSATDGCPNTPSIDVGTPEDYLYIVTAGARGLHPNPARGECVWGDGATHYWSDGTIYSPTLAADPGYTPPIGGYVRDAGDSTDGLIEYTSNAFGGTMQHNLIAATYDGDQNVRRVVLTPDGTGVQAIYMLGQFAEPLDVWTDAPGNIYVAEFGANQITVMIPSQPGT